MDVLVGYATAHGSTKGVAERIAARLRGRGAEVTLAELPVAEDIERYGAVVLGSAIHSGDWLPEAEQFVDSHARALAGRETWLFSVCSLGDSNSFFPERVARFMSKQRKDGKQLARWRLLIGEGHHRYFVGAVERGHWSRLGDLFLRACRRHVRRPPRLGRHRCLGRLDRRRHRSDSGGLTGAFHHGEPGRTGERPRRQNMKRVRPPGSAPNTTVAERGSMRYTFHGGGPCDGRVERRGDARAALVGLGRPTAVGPRLRRRAPRRPGRSRASRRPRRRRPRRGSTGRSSSAGRARRCGLARAGAGLEPERAVQPEGTDRSDVRAAVLVDRVASHVVRALCASGAGADPASSFSVTASQSTGGRPSAAPRLMISIDAFLSMSGTVQQHL